MRIAALVAVLAVATPAAADRREPKVHYVYDGVIAGAATLVYAISEFAYKDDLAPATCKWCEPDGPNGLDAAVRDALRWDDTEAAHTISNVSGFILAPVSALGLIGLAAHDDGRIGNWGRDALLIYEASILSTNLNQLAKFTVGRRRPYASVDDVGSDDHVSFYSGHTSWTFALAVSSGTVASMRGYRLAPVIWVSGLTLATVTGWLRIAGDRHYFTDVLTGAVLGSAFGFVVPYVFHRGPEINVGVGKGPSFTVAWRF